MRLISLLVVVPTIIFSLACGADNTTPGPTPGTQATSPTAPQEATAGPTDTPRCCIHLAAHSGSGGHPHHISPSRTEGRTDASAGTDGNPGADTSSGRNIHTGPFANGCAGADAHIRVYSCANGDTCTGGHQVANHTTDDNNSSPALGAEAHPHDYRGRSPQGNPRLRPG